MYFIGSRSNVVFFFARTMEELNLESQLLSLIAEARHHLTRVPSKIPGSSKLKGLISADVNFLTSLAKNPSKIKPDHITCSNISYYAPLLYCLEHERDIVSILQPFTIEDGSNIRVDIQCEHGTRWVFFIPHVNSLDQS